METPFTKVTVQANVNAPVGKVWETWTTPEHIIKWNNASPDWHTPVAENDVRIGGKFLSRMEARDSSFGFDFEGVYDAVVINELISYNLADGRNVKIIFIDKGYQTEIIETFDAENENPIEMQRGGWQAILDNFKHHTENR